MTDPGFGPDQAAHLAAAVHGLDAFLSTGALLKPLAAIGLAGVGVAFACGQVASRMRQSPSVRPSVSQPSLPRGGKAGTPSTDAAGRGRRKVVQDAADIAGQSDAARVSYWGDILVERSVVLWHGPYKTGKTTLLTEGLKHIIQGKPYLDWGTTKTAAVYFSEETSEIWRDKAASIAGATTPMMPRWEAILRLVPGPVSWGTVDPRRRPSFKPRWWRRFRGYRSVFHVEGPSVPHLRGIENVAALMAYADATARAVGAKIIILDTLKHFCSEAQGAYADDFINAVKGLAARDYCVIIVHHDNDNGTPLGSKSLAAGVDALVHQHRVKGLPETASEREVEFQGRFRLGRAPETLRYRLDPQTERFVRSGSSTGKTVPQTVAPAAGLEPATTRLGVGRSSTELHGTTNSLAPLPLPVLSPPAPMVPTPLRVVKTPPGRDAICQAIVAQLTGASGTSGASSGPWTRAQVRDMLIDAGVVKRAAVYAHLKHLLEDALLVSRDDGRLALKTETTEKEATA